VTSDDLRDEAALRERIAALEAEMAALRRSVSVLEAREDRLMDTLDAAHVGTWVWNIATGSVQWSDNLERIHRQEAGSFQGTFHGFLDGVHREDRERVLKAIQRATLEGQDYHVEYRSADGDEVWLEARGRVIFADDGAPLWMLGVCMDITERKQLHLQLRHTQRLESLGLLAGGIAHDFNNLLTGIMGNASLALDRLAEPDPTRPLLQGVVTASRRAADLTRQLLAYAGKGRFLIQDVEVSRLVDDTIPLVRSSLPDSVQVCLDLSPVPVRADAGQIHQLVMNLVINAAEAIGQGKPGTIAVSTGIRELNEASAPLPPGRYCCLEVRDTGCGMSEDTLARIFDPFFTTKFSGRGLGLAAALGIVRGHHGNITVRSRPGAGTTFTVLLPLSDTQAKPASQEVANADLAGSGTILVVDDEEVVLGMAEASLMSFGYRPLLAGNGRSAVEIVAESGNRIRAVVLDLTMPEMSGEETLQQLRAIQPGLPVIIASGYGETEINERFEGQTISAFLQKPYTPVQLAKTIRYAIGA
jgi:two-component system cell cycle sensor histidine kinase/response regulator CckA